MNRRFDVHENGSQPERIGQGQEVGWQSDPGDCRQDQRVRALAIRAGALGDTIVALPAIAALRTLGCVELVGTAPYVELALGPGLAAATHSIDRAMFRALFHDGAEEAELLGFLSRFDRVVAWSRLPLLAAKLDGIGVELIQSDPLPPDGVHASDHLMEALEPLGINGPPPFPSIPVKIKERATGFPLKFVAIHPSSGSENKNWAPKYFEALARLVRTAGLDVVWIQGEADESVVPGLARQVPGPVALQLPLDELAAVLADCAVFVGNDSGVSHLAAAVGAPTVALFRTTDPAQWAPRGPYVHIARAGASPEAVWGLALDLMNAH